jgi:hypothetical protein
MFRKLLILLLLSPMLAVTAIAEDNAASMSIERAVAHVGQPRNEFGVNTGTNGDLQIRYRLLSLLHFSGETYQYDTSHAPAWKAVLEDENQEVYARLCAAYFLLDQEDEEARAYVESILDSENMRHRFNAAEMVRMHVGYGREIECSVALLITILEEGCG